MTDQEKKICKLTLETAKLISKKEFEYEGKHVEQFVVEEDGEEYLITKHDGEFVYFHHVIKPKEDSK